MTFLVEKEFEVVDKHTYLKSIMDVTLKFLESSSKLNQDLWNLYC